VLRRPIEAALTFVPGWPDGPILESTLVLAETEFEPTTKFSLPRRIRK
jgi:hypothetical protein